MIIAILGAGQLGLELYQSIKNLYKCDIYQHKNFNICNISQLHKIVKQYDIIINCVANIKADKIQDIQRQDSYNVNYLAVKNLAILCKRYNRVLIHISSDYVYGSNNYQDKLDQKYQCTPINQYGKDKLQAQKAIIKQELNNYLILRVAWLIGKYGKQNFIQKILNKLINNTQIKVVNDQIGNITSTKTVIEVIKLYISGKIQKGIYNVQNNDQVVSRYDIAKYIKLCINSKCKIIPCKTSDYILPAKRQLNSNICTDKIRKYIKLKNWKDIINQYIQDKNK